MYLTYMYRFALNCLLINIIYCFSTVQKKILFAHTSIYIGTFIGSTFLIFSVGVYFILNNSIKMAKKLKHSLPNTWFAMAMFYLIYW